MQAERFKQLFNSILFYKNLSKITCSNVDVRSKCFDNVNLRTLKNHPV